jgi:hypothetical protein
VTSFRQFDANRRNALKSTGPATDAGKQRSRRNAVRHGLTAESVITTLEDEEDYKAFELSVTSGFNAPTAVERELVLRLASLLWRLRRATAIDTGLLQLQSKIMGALANPQEPRTRVNGGICKGPIACNGGEPSPQSDPEWSNDRSDQTVSYIRPNHAPGAGATLNTDIARCFLRLANLDNGAFERANRYEMALGRQVGQVLLTLDFLRRSR